MRGWAGAVVAGVVAGGGAPSRSRRVVRRVGAGRIDVQRLRTVVASTPIPRAADGRIVLAVDVTCWLRPEAHTGSAYTRRRRTRLGAHPAGDVVRAPGRRSATHA
ncbi:transposase [Salinispora arenicola]|uniref:transposase n=1 Tax=Salinispora arenicola TaxID=168697 RepID=UPI0034675C06